MALHVTQWAVNYQLFLDDSSTIRSASPNEKNNFFASYNTRVAVNFQTLEANFWIWTNILAAIHPPPGTRVHLHVREEHQGDYDTEYQFADTRIRLVGAGLVWHYLEPVHDDRDYRAILLFRGTSLNPATYRTQNGLLDREPMGAWADGNLFGVARMSFPLIHDEIATWLDTQSNVHRRNITFIGSSLGGALSMRSLKCHLKHQNPGCNQSELYVYSSPGLERKHARELTRLRGENFRQMHAYWHARDAIALTGYYPRVVGQEFSQSRPHASAASRTVPKKLSFLKKHLLPFLSIQEGWGVILAYSRNTVDEGPTVSEFYRYSSKVIRQFPLGFPCCWLITGGMGLLTQSRKALSRIFDRKVEDFCGHHH
ncbi:unnamed protein product [Aspergillus oryzae]|nr:unnamed protein product [Aspergillus oryzae]GMF85088.1 unnamed protein product [Aspergillus oryzae]